MMMCHDFMFAKNVSETSDICLTILHAKNRGQINALAVKNVFNDVKVWCKMH